MSELPDELDQLVMVGGAGGLHSDLISQHVLVAPAAGEQFNTLRLPLNPVACVLLKDSRFEFDSSFIGPRVVIQMRFLDRLRKRSPGIVATVFGHADPVGDDSYNKQLSGRYLWHFMCGWGGVRRPEERLRLRHGPVAAVRRQ